MLRAKRELNNNAIRLSVEWSRIFPNPTFDVPAKVVRDNRGDVERVDLSRSSMDYLEEKASKESVKHYREILEKAHELGLKVLLTIYHWPLPLWIHDPLKLRNGVIHAERRGWLDDSTIVEFAKLSLIHI